MPLQEIRDLPPLAIIAFGISLAIIYFVTKGGFSSGQKATPASSASSAQVAAVIVDSSAINRATAALEAQTVEYVHNRLAVESNKIALEREIGNLCRSIDRLCVEVDDLKKEIIRKGH